MSNLSNKNNSTNSTNFTNFINSTNSTNDYTLPRKARLEDFFDDSDFCNNKHYNKNHSNNYSDINKNQENFGHRRRIKP